MTRRSSTDGRISVHYGLRKAHAVTVVDAELVTYEVLDGVAVITWNRPDRNNAWSPDLEGQYFARLQQAADDPEARVIVVRGAGRHFCPGTDVAALSEIAAGAPTVPLEERTALTFPMSIPKLIVVAIHGACAGTGFIQSAVADVRFAEPDARITTAFARRGIMAEHGLSVLLPKLLGLSRAMDLLVSARVVSGQEAFEIGFVTHVSAPGQVFDEALAYAQDVAGSCSPLAVAVTKQQLYDAVGVELDAARLESFRIWRELKPQGDFGEGVESFREKRKPAFAPLTAESYDAFNRFRTKASNDG